MSGTTDREIEAKFLEIDKEALIKKLRELGAEDKGEDFLREIIFYDRAGKWIYDEKKFVRIRSSRKGTQLTFKQQEEGTIDGTKELEVAVSDAETAARIMEESGLVRFREQEKRRHKFLLGEVIVDIDTWPKVPTYVELEGPSEETIKAVANKLGFDWSKAVFGTARFVIEKYYHLPVSEYKFFTFDRVE